MQCRSDTISLQLVRDSLSFLVQCRFSDRFSEKKVETAENILKSRTLINRCILMIFETYYWRRNCLETFEIKNAKWYILMLFETMFWKLELQRNYKIKDADRY